MAHVGASIDDFIRRTSLRRMREVNLRRLYHDERDRTPHFELIQSNFCPKRRWIDGSPENIEHSLLLRQLFPAARFIVIVRDPFDVIASMVNFGRAGGAPMTIDQAARMWLRKTRAGLQAYRAFGPDVVKLLFHATLMEETAQTIAEIYDFLGEPYFGKSAQTFRHRINTSSVREDERAQIREIAQNSAVAKDLNTLLTDLRRTLTLRWTRDESAISELEETQRATIARYLPVSD
jgi:hypothetical protein